VSKVDFAVWPGGPRTIGLQLGCNGLAARGPVKFEGKTAPPARRHLAGPTTPIVKAGPLLTKLANMTPEGPRHRRPHLPRGESTATPSRVTGGPRAQRWCPIVFSLNLNYRVPPECVARRGRAFHLRHLAGEDARGRKSPNRQPQCAAQWKPTPWLEESSSLPVVKAVEPKQAWTDVGSIRRFAISLPWNFGPGEKRAGASKETNSRP